MCLFLDSQFLSFHPPPYLIVVSSHCTQVRVVGARNLPVMDGRLAGAASQTAATVTGLLGSSPSTDAYVTVSLGGHAGLISENQEEFFVSGGEAEKTYTARTKVCRRTLNPVWDEEFRFEIADDTLLQDEPLIFKVCDSESLGADESIGLVYIDLNPLLTQTAKGEEYDGEKGISGHFRGGSDFSDVGFIASNSDLGKPDLSRTTSARNSSTATGVIDGYFPLYDTLGGVRGELGLSVKLKFIGDVNPFRDSSAGVELFPFSTLDPAAGYTVSHVFGFVEELLVADDPEYQWEENFRQARTSHETRQTLLYIIDASVRRRMCKKVLEVSYWKLEISPWNTGRYSLPQLLSLDGRKCGAWIPPKLRRRGRLWYCSTNVRNMCLVGEKWRYFQTIRWLYLKYHF